MYGLDSAQLNQDALHKLETFHLNGLRKIFHIDTTFGQMQQGLERTNRNDKVYKVATAEFNKEIKYQFNVHSKKISCIISH